ncbi:MAG: DNA recombination protein RmuC [Actinomycetota bacterium]
MIRVIVFTAVVVGVGVALIWFAVAALRRSLDLRLATTDAELRRLGDASIWRERGSDLMRQEVSAFRNALEQMRIREEERRAREEEGWATLHRVAAVLAGSQRTGRAGENVLRESLAHLPPSMVVTDFRVNGRVVEFGLVLPDGRRLPVDSKWPAQRELRALAETSDPSERDRLIRLVERAVVERAREVSGYRDPAITAPVGVAAVPDAAYAVLRRAHAEAYREGVIVIPYSMALPVVLFLHSIVARFGATGDVDACLAELTIAMDTVEATLENRLAKASSMLRGGIEELRGQMGKARATLSRAREVEGQPSEHERPHLVGLHP